MRSKLLLCLIAAAAAAFGQKRTLAVEDFDYSAVMSEVQAIFGAHIPVGRGINAMMVKRVAQSGKFTVVERNKVNDLMKEQDFGASGRVERKTAARIGKIKGADLFLMGDVVVFGRDDQRKRAGGGVSAAGVGVGGFGGKADYKAVVVLDYRVVDAETSEVVMTGEARGESKRSSKGGGLGLLAGGVRIGAAADFTSSNFAETIIGEALMDAVNQLADTVNQQAGGVGAKQVEIEGQVANVSGSVVYINVGALSGVQVGDSFEVSRLGKPIKDPTTGEVLDQESSPVGRLVITQVRDKIAIGNFSGGGAAQVGDRVEKK